MVDQTAIETAAEDLQIHYGLHKHVPLRGPLGETGVSWIVVAFAASLDEALVALPARGHLLAVGRGRHHRAGSLRAGQHGGQLPGHPVRQPDRLGLHLDPAQGGTRGHPQSVFPDDIRARIAAWLRP